MNVYPIPMGSYEVTFKGNDRYAHDHLLGFDLLEAIF